MQKAKIRLPWTPIDLCPCSSGLTLKRCCGGIDGSPRASKFDLERASDQTGINLKGCYLAKHANCGSKISLEHPISRNILEQFSNFALRGFKDTDGTIDVIIPAKSAGYKVLCDRHNSDLSSLDDHAGRFFRDLGPAVFPIRHPQDENLLNWVFVDGPKIEAWAIKVIAAHQAVGNFTERGVPVSYQTDWNKIHRAILKGQFEPKGGLYICAARSPNEIDGVQFSAISSQGWLIGVRLVVRGFSFAVLFDPERASEDTLPANATYRGSVHQLFGQGGSAFLFIAWHHRPNLRSYSRGQLYYSQTGSSSTAPFKLLDGPPQQDIRTKVRPSKPEDALAFAPQPVGPVHPASPPLTKQHR